MSLVVAGREVGCRARDRQMVGRAGDDGERRSVSSVSDPEWAVRVIEPARTPVTVSVATPFSAVGLLRPETVPVPAFFRERDRGRVVARAEVAGRIPHLGGDVTRGSRRRRWWSRW